VTVVGETVKSEKRAVPNPWLAVAVPRLSETVMTTMKGPALE